MTQSAARIANVKWNISVPPDLMRQPAFTLRLKEVKRGSLFFGPKGGVPLHHVFAYGRSQGKGTCVWAIPE